MKSARLLRREAKRVTTSGQLGHRYEPRLCLLYSSGTFAARAPRLKACRPVAEPKYGVPVDIPSQALRRTPQITSFVDTPSQDFQQNGGALARRLLNTLAAFPSH